MSILKKSIYLGLSLAALCILSGCGSTEDKNTEVSTDISTEASSTESAHEEDRIVALSVSLVDILAELDVDMVGVPTSQYDLNEKVADVTQVGLSMSPDVELIATLNPTHVLSLTTLESMVGDKFTQAGITPTYLNVENIDTLKESITTLGDMFDRQEEAQELVADFEADIHETIQSVADKEAPKVLVLFGFPGNYLVGTSTSFVGQLSEMLGAENVVKDNSSAYASVNLEALVVEQPDVILRLTHGVKDEVLEMFDKEFKENPIWSQFDAVKNGKVYDLDDSLFNVSASLDSALALEELSKILYE